MARESLVVNDARQTTMLGGTRSFGNYGDKISQRSMN
jgi:hypothetical protein